MEHCDKCNGDSLCRHCLLHASARARQPLYVPTRKSRSIPADNPPIEPEVEHDTLSVDQSGEMHFLPPESIPNQIDAPCDTTSQRPIPDVFTQYRDTAGSSSSSSSRSRPRFRSRGVAQGSARPGVNEHAIVSPNSIVRVSEVPQPESSVVPKERTRTRGVIDTSDDTWITTGPVPGGPTNPQILIGFRGHVAHKIWEHSEFRGPLTTHTRDKCQQKWPMEYMIRSRPWVQMVEASGLSKMGSLMLSRPNESLISAFVERWQPETNTFHMPFGEMTITLHDVDNILDYVTFLICITDIVIGLPIRGEVVRSGTFVCDDEFLNNVTFKKTNKKAASLHAIRTSCLNQSISDSSKARGYLWYLLGTTLFPDKSHSYVSTDYLGLLGNLDAVSKYAWGAATLAYLYHCLGVASRYDCKQLTGCLTLLECWIYEYFPMYARAPASNWTGGSPRAERWEDNNTRNSSMDDLLRYRKQLDNMKADMVTWTPYGPPAKIPPGSYYHGCVRFLNFNEPYMPDRVTRQFGRVQGIPDPIIPMGPKTKLHPNARCYKKVYSDYDIMFNQYETHCYNKWQFGEEAFCSHYSTPDYLPWFKAISHVTVHNPAHDHIQEHPSTLHTIAQQRLGPVRETLHTMSIQASQDPQVPQYIRQGIDNALQIIGTGGVPGLDPTPFTNWWGQSTWTEDDFNHNVAPNTCSNPASYQQQQPDMDTEGQD